MSQPEDDFASFAKSVQDSMGDFMTTMARKGAMRRSDGKALFMVPEEDADPRDESLNTSHMYCGNCRAFVEVKHKRPLDEIEMPTCSCCRAKDWHETDETSGFTGGSCTAAPRLY